MAVKAKHLLLGAAGEEAAVRHLLGLGWKIRVRNWRPPGPRHALEIDIIAHDAAYLVFVEVKTRLLESLAPEQELIPVHAAFSPAKRRKITQAAMLFLNHEELWDIPCRFDLICVKRTPKGESLLEHHDNVIEFGNLVDSGHAPWQPW